MEWVLTEIARCGSLSALTFLLTRLASNGDLFVYRPSAHFLNCCGVDFIQVHRNGSAGAQTVRTNMFGKDAVSRESEVFDSLFERGVHVGFSENSALVRRGREICAQDRVTSGSVCSDVFDAAN